MAPVYSKPLATHRVAERIQSHVSSFPPPRIAFARSRRASATILQSNQRSRVRNEVIRLTRSRKRRRSPSSQTKMVIRKCGASDENNR
jgi:hypothetical protein